MTYLPELTIKYKTYTKKALVQGLGPVFKNHIDQSLQNVKVTIDFPRTQAAFPAVVVRFYEREISNAGVGHREVITDDDGKAWVFKHYFYTGDIEFSIYALTSLDLDLIADTVVQTIAMGELDSYTNRFLARIYPDDDGATYPDALAHFININTDRITGFGERQSPTPWGAEDDLVYQSSYRISTFGEFYSPPPRTPSGVITEVKTYPYIGGTEPVPEGTSGDGTPWQSLTPFTTVDSEN